MTGVSNTFTPGLEGIVAAETAISSVDGEKGELLIRGYDVQDFAPAATFEETLFLLWHGARPDATSLADLRARLAASRQLDPLVVRQLAGAAARGVDPMDALRMACASIDGSTPGTNRSDSLEAARQDALRLVAAVPVAVATYHRLLCGLEPIASRPDLSQAADFLHMLHGGEAAAGSVRALDTYWNAVADHGLNASTFAARVIVSTESDLVSAVTGAIGALKGRLHGGAPGPVLDLLFDIGAPDRAERVLRERLARGERLMGFGHRVYRTRDPRALVLAAAARKLYASDADRRFYEMAVVTEATARRLLREHKPDRPLETNVEFYTALLLHGLGFPAALFTPVFAAGRVAGWTAHGLEQRASNRLFRPESTYTGRRGRTWARGSAGRMVAEGTTDS